MSIIELKNELDRIEGAIWWIEIGSDFLSWNDKEKIRDLNNKARAIRAQIADVEGR